MKQVSLQGYDDVLISTEVEEALTSLVNFYNESDKFRPTVLLCLHDILDLFCFADKVNEYYFELCMDECLDLYEQLKSVG